MLHEIFDIDVEGEPKGQPRARACIRSRHASVYDPGTANDWKRRVWYAIQPVRPEQPLCQPLCLDLEFRFRRPASHSGRKGLRPTAPRAHTSKPDLDNLAKAVLDELVQGGVLRDDAIVQGLKVTKRWCEGVGGCRIVLWSETQDGVPNYRWQKPAELNLDAPAAAPAGFAWPSP